MSFITAIRAETMHDIRAFHLMGIVALTGIILVAGCTEPRGELAGCTADNQCKQDRVCDQGVCVDPSARGDAGTKVADTGDAGTKDAGSDTDTADTGACVNAPTAAASIAVDGQALAQSVQAAPDSLIHLDGRASTSAKGAIKKYEWSFIQFPYQSSVPDLKPKLNTSARGTASFQAKTIGTYVLELNVEDAHGTKNCAAARVAATIKTDAEIYVELVWDTPGDRNLGDDVGADLDLHYKHPQGDWGYKPLDIFWYNTTADWGSPGSDDDPKLIFDDADGTGPESIVHRHAEPLKYGVGVYYYADYNLGPSDATIRVYLDGTLSREIKKERMHATDNFYDALTIDAANKTTHLIDAHYDGYPPVQP